MGSMPNVSAYMLLQTRWRGKYNEHNSDFASVFKCSNQPIRLNSCNSARHVGSVWVRRECNDLVRSYVDVGPLGFTTVWPSEGYKQSPLYTWCVWILRLYATLSCAILCLSCHVLPIMVCWSVNKIYHVLYLRFKRLLKTSFWITQKFAPLLIHVTHGHMQDVISNKQWNMSWLTSMEFVTILISKQFSRCDITSSSS